LYRTDREAEDFDAIAVKTEIRRRLGLEIDLAGFETLWKRDNILRKLPDEMMGARPSSPFSLYEFLMICVFLQNTTIRRTVAMANALASEIGQELMFPDGITLRSFWRSNELTSTGEQRLRDLKLGYRAKILDQISQQFYAQPELESQLLRDSTDEDILRYKLISLYGIGPASVGYIMFEWFKRVNYFDHISPWELKILGQLLFKSNNVPMEKMIAFCRQRWSPFTMLAIHAIFESIFWRRSNGEGLGWIDALIRL
jgi:3-methyladenine DNA glycosylase/8-oxoguanine DNA glycosylase